MSLTPIDIENSKISYVHSGNSDTEDSAIIQALGQASAVPSVFTFRIESEDETRPQPSKSASFLLTVSEGIWNCFVNVICLTLKI